MSLFPAYFSETLTGLRKRLGVTQAELARRAGMDRRRVSEYERGLALPGAERLERLVRVLGGRVVDGDDR